jgi:hypothetical protein
MNLFDGPDDFLDDSDDSDAVPADVAGLLAGLRSDELAQVQAALAEITVQELAAVQDEVAQLLLNKAWCADVALADQVLAFLAKHGDGRCVRPMEEALHENGRKLTEHQAWRGRHIVQKIRRFGRK